MSDETEVTTKALVAELERLELLAWRDGRTEDAGTLATAAGIVRAEKPPSLERKWSIHIRGIQTADVGELYQRLTWRIATVTAKDEAAARSSVDLREGEWIVQVTEIPNGD